MQISYLPYEQYLASVPDKGCHILAHQTEHDILVYQAFNHDIGDYALRHQRFGGGGYNYSRMTWVKPNFLWMMFRCGWAEKENQERVLGIWVKKTGFLKILNQAVHSNYQEKIYLTQAKWKQELSAKQVRLQWDPDHDIHGNKLERRAIQLGLKDRILMEFNNDMISGIEDMTPFVKSQKQKIAKKQISALQLPEETVFSIADQRLARYLAVDAV